MAVETTPRLGLKKYTSGNDLHPNRTEFNALQDLLERLVAITDKGTTAARPSAGTEGRYYWSTDDLRLYYDDGTAWRDVNPNGGGGAGAAITVAGQAKEGTSARAARADHTHNLPLATGSTPGAMSAADKAAMDAATPSATGGTIAKRSSAGHLDSPAPTLGPHVANKGYVDAEVAKRALSQHSHNAGDINTGVLDPARLPTATQLLQGALSAADKTKLDGATASATGGSVVMRNSTGQIAIGDPKHPTHATTQAYVDGVAAERVAYKGDLGSTNLNTLTERGEYVVVAASNVIVANGYPISGSVGSVSVRPFGGAGWVFQEFTEWSSNRQWLRSTNDAGKTWRGWTETASTATATGTADGLLAAADKAKLDKATSSPTGGTVVLRDSNGDAGFRAVALAETTAAGHAARKDYVDAEVAKRALTRHTHSYNDVVVNTLATEDLDTLTEQGLYHQNANANATPERNYPTNAAGMVEVTTNSNFIYQRYSGYASNNRVFYRSKYNNAWSAWQEVAVASQKADVAHKHTGADITSGTISPDRIANATGTLDGLMSKADKAKLDKASSTNTASTLVMLDSAGRARVNNPANVLDIANKGYVDTATSGVRTEIATVTAPLVENAVEHFTTAPVAGPGKPTDKPFKHFAGWINRTTGAGGQNPNATPCTDPLGYGGVWFGQDGVPQFSGIYFASVQMRNVDGYHAVIVLDDITLTRIRYRGRKLDGSHWSNSYFNAPIYVEVWGW